MIDDGRGTTAESNWAGHSAVEVSESNPSFPCRAGLKTGYIGGFLENLFRFSSIAEAWGGRQIVPVFFPSVER